MRHCRNIRLENRITAIFGCCLRAKKGNCIVITHRVRARVCVQTYALVLPRQYCISIKNSIHGNSNRNKDNKHSRPNATPKIWPYNVRMLPRSSPPFITHVLNQCVTKKMCAEDTHFEINIGFPFTMLAVSFCRSLARIRGRNLPRNLLESKQTLRLRVWTLP